MADILAPSAAVLAAREPCGLSQFSEPPKVYDHELYPWETGVNGIEAEARDLAWQERDSAGSHDPTAASPK